MREAESIKIASEAEHQKYITAQQTLNEQQNLISYQKQNQLILEQKMHETLRRAEEQS